MSMPGQTKDQIAFLSGVFKDVADGLEKAEKETSNRRHFFLNLEHVAISWRKILKGACKHTYTYTHVRNKMNLKEYMVGRNDLSPN